MSVVLVKVVKHVILIAMICARDSLGLNVHIIRREVMKSLILSLLLEKKVMKKFSWILIQTVMERKM